MAGADLLYRRDATIRVWVLVLDALYVTSLAPFSRLDRACQFTRTAHCGSSARRLAVAGLCLPGFPCLSFVGGVCSFLARACQHLIVSNVKRDASLARRPLKPARAVHVRLSPADTQIAPLSPDMRLSQGHNSCRLDF